MTCKELGDIFRQPLLTMFRSSTALHRDGGYDEIHRRVCHTSVAHQLVNTVLRRSNRLIGGCCAVDTVTLFCSISVTRIGTAMTETTDLFYPPPNIRGH